MKGKAQEDGEALEALMKLNRLLQQMRRGNKDATKVELNSTSYSDLLPVN